MLFSKDARLTEQHQRAMAAEAEASREARAKVIAADGEMRASKALREASNVIEQSPSALQLRYLQVSRALLEDGGGFGVGKGGGGGEGTVSSQGLKRPLLSLPYALPSDLPRFKSKISLLPPFLLPRRTA